MTTWNNENNFFLIDKPLSITSFDVIWKLRKALWIKKMWHAGTLDPLASGLLLVATWNYTKLLSHLIIHDKVYEFTIALNGTSPSFDLWTEVSYISIENQEEAKKTITLEKIQRILLEKFTGTIKQTPPKYSAIKVNWMRAYEKMREWEIDFELKEKEITIFSIEILSYEYPLLTLRTHVSSWTYIRSIARDLWEILWTGWYITHLRRTKIGNLDIWLADKIENISPSKNLPISLFFPKTISFSDEIISELNFWRSVVIWENDFQNGEEIFVEKHWFLTHIVRIENGKISPVRKII